MKKATMEDNITYALAKIDDELENCGKTIEMCQSFIEDNKGEEIKQIHQMNHDYETFAKTLKAIRSVLVTDDEGFTYFNKTIGQAQKNAEKEIKSIVTKIKDIDNVYNLFIDENNRQILIAEQNRLIEELKMICRIFDVDPRDYYEGLPED